jgi:hypothetical protein
MYSLMAYTLLFDSLIILFSLALEYVFDMD